MAVLPDNSHYSYLDTYKANHDLKATDIRLVLSQIFLKSIWISEKCIKPDPGFEFIPDAVFHYYNHKNIYCEAAIEIELSQKSKRRYKNKFDEYFCTHYTFVLYCIQQESLGAVIFDQVDHLKRRHNFRDMIFIVNIHDLLINKENAVLTSYTSKINLKEGFLAQNKVE
jgi:hypothetical protein